MNVLELLPEMTGGRGPDSVIDAVGMDAHGYEVGSVYDRTWQAIMACRKGGTVSVPGVYGGLLDKLPFGAALAKGLTFKMGQTQSGIRQAGPAESLRRQSVHCRIRPGPKPRSRVKVCAGGFPGGENPSG